MLKTEISVTRPQCVKNVWSYNLYSPICLPGVQWDNFNFTRNSSQFGADSGNIDALSQFYMRRRQKAYTQ